MKQWLNLYTFLKIILTWISFIAMIFNYICICMRVKTIKRNCAISNIMSQNNTLLLHYNKLLCNHHFLLSYSYKIFYWKYLINNMYFYCLLLHNHDVTMYLRVEEISHLANNLNLIFASLWARAEIINWIVLLMSRINPARYASNDTFL